MIGYVTLGTRDLARGAKFYECHSQGAGGGPHGGIRPVHRGIYVRRGYPWWVKWTRRAGRYV